MPRSLRIEIEEAKANKRTQVDEIDSDFELQDEEICLDDVRDEFERQFDSEEPPKVVEEELLPPSREEE